MTFEQSLILALLVYQISREAVYHWNTQKLVNKLMSRNFYDFKVSEEVGKINKKAVQPNVHAFDGMVDPHLQEMFTP